MAYGIYVVLAAIVTLVSVLYRPFAQQLQVAGVFTPLSSITNIHGTGLKKIPNTAQCEDIHWHAASDLLFTACHNDGLQKKLDWFPAIGNLAKPESAGMGSLHVIDPKTFENKELQLVGFKGPWVAHGIDVVNSGIPNVVHIFAINHLPNPDYWDPAPGTVKASRKARSQIEMFRHVIGSDEARWMRTIRDPLIRTPNDIHATGPRSFYVTDDHYYSEPPMWVVETLLPPLLAHWGSIIHVEIADSASVEPTAGLNVSTAYKGMHYPNGLSRVSDERPHEFLIADATGGQLHRVARRIERGAAPDLKLIETIQLQSGLDNPTFYEDPYATATNNATGYLMAGLMKGADTLDQLKNPLGQIPTIVWHVRADSIQGEEHAKWEQRIIFRDDGKMLPLGTVAVMTPIDPAENGGKKQAWLWVGALVAEAIVATKIDL